MINFSLLTILFMVMSYWVVNYADVDVYKRECQSFPFASLLTNFGAKLRDKLEPAGNVIVPHHVIYNLLTIIRLATKGQTSEEIKRNILNIKLNVKEQEFASSDYWSKIYSQFSKPNFKEFLAIYMQKTKTDKAFSEISHILGYFKYDLYLVDFTKKDELMASINSRIAHVTYNQITDFLEQPFESTTSVTAVCAAYIRSKWSIPFDRRKIRFDTFHMSKNSTKEVLFMFFNHAFLRYYHDELNNIAYIELPLEKKKSNISMILALPTNEIQSKYAEPLMDSSYLCYIKTCMQYIEFDTVKIPLFRLQYAKDLVNILRQFGITRLFSNDSDLSGIMKDKGHKVSNFIMKAVIEVDAVTDEELESPPVIVLPVLGKTEFYVDRPFSVYFTNMFHNYVFLSGRVVDPTQLPHTDGD